MKLPLSRAIYLCMHPASAHFLLRSLFSTEDGGYVALKHWTFTKLHGITIPLQAVEAHRVVRG
jgi:hypothetical protein